ncbi:DNA polymerase III subunit alpha [Candidatus Hodgkinia cicadicola]
MLLDKRAFINLKVHSVYSMLESTLSINRIAELALAHAQLGVCLADTNLHGALEFCVKCKHMGIQPIIAIKLLVDDQRALFTRAQALVVTLIVRTERGYINLLKLINTSACVSGYYMITLSQLETHSEGLTLLIGEIEGLAWEIYKQSEMHTMAARFSLLRQLVNNQLCFELQRRVFVNRQYESVLIKYANANALPIVATNETFFESPQQYEVYKALNTVARVCARFVTSQNHFKGYFEMLTRYADIQYALTNTILFCKACEFYLAQAKHIMLPTFMFVRARENRALYIQLVKSLERLFYEIGKANKRAYYKRLFNELNVVLRTRYSGYFLIVMDFVLWAKTNKIMVGPGRGSAAGSLLAYCANITNVDPIQHGLLFERFLNPARVSPPDIDVDFCHSARDNLIRYIQARHTCACAAQISTFNVLQLKGALKDAGRCLQLQFDTVNAICARVSTRANVHISALLARYAETLIPQHAANKLIDMALSFMGVCKHAGVHAAGVVIANSPLVEHVPTIWDPNSKTNITQYNMDWVSAAGLSKFDLLGLKTLTIISDVLKLLAINKIEPNLDFRDEKTYRFVCQGLLLSVFQLEGEGIAKHIKHMLPSNLNDLAALIALYRPGPIKKIRLYSDIKHARVTRISIHNDIDRILDDTHGIIIYQEQVMLIAQALAGYSLAEADELRKAMTKKNKAEMLAHAQRFINGACRRAFSKQLAASVFETLLRFADYGFNKSHALAYAMLTYITAYLKCNFTLEYYAVSLTAELEQTNDVAALYYEALSLEVEFLSPNVQTPYTEFRLINGVIQFPLTSIKTLPKSVVNSIALSRASRPFVSLMDFCYRCDSRFITKRVLKVLALSGALSCFKLSKTQIMSNLDSIFECVVDKTHTPIAVRSSCCKTDLETLYNEYLLLGCYVSEHPIDELVCARRGFKLAIVVEQLKTSLILIFQTSKLEVDADIDYSLSLGQLYACKISYARKKPVCEVLYRVYC